VNYTGGIKMENRNRLERSAPKIANPHERPTKKKTISMKGVENSSGRERLVEETIQENEV